MSKPENSSGKLETKRTTDSQFCRQIAGRVISTLDDVIAFIDGLEQTERVADAEERGEAARKELASWRSRILVDLIR